MKALIGAVLLCSACGPIPVEGIYRVSLVKDDPTGMFDACPKLQKYETATYDFGTTGDLYDPNYQSSITSNKPDQKVVSVQITYRPGGPFKTSNIDLSGAGWPENLTGRETRTEGVDTDNCRLAFYSVTATKGN